MNLRPVFYVIGTLLCILSASMVVPMLVDLYFLHPDWKVFLICMVTTFFFGGLLILTNKTEKIEIRTREGFLLTTLSWVLVSFFGALPLWFSELDLNLTDAVFESVSGLTTTGATIIAGLNEAPPGLLLWRSILQWLGGIGIIVMALSLLPFLGIGGMQLFRTESSEHEKAMPRATELAKNITIIYCLLTVLCIISYTIAGFKFFDAFCHGLTTISTGGFSTYDTSFINIEGFEDELTCIVFMLLGSIPFVLYLKFIRGNRAALLKDEQVRWFLGLLSIAIIIMSAWLVLFNSLSISDALRYSSFNIISIVTTTGYASVDYNSWGLFPAIIFFFLTFIGGCNGSTAGGIKIFRLQVIYAVTSSQVKKLLSPNGVYTSFYNNKPIPQDVPLSVMSFFFLFALNFTVLSVLLSMCGIDFITAMSGAATALANVGPGLGTVIGPTGNFASLPDAAKWLLAIGMIMGRLELFTVMVLVLPRFWRP